MHESTRSFDMPTICVRASCATSARWNAQLLIQIVAVMAWGIEPAKRGLEEFADGR